MMKNNRTLIISGSIISIGAITAYAFYKKAENKKTVKYINDVLDGKIADPTTGGAQKIIPQAQLSLMPTGTFPLKFGDKNQKVYALQVAVNKKYQAGIDLDGRFGQSLADTLCRHYFTLCTTVGTGLIARQRTISNEDYTKLVN